MALEGIFRRLTWETRSLKNIFADDILICANTQHELQQMLQELADERENRGLKMNMSKTKVMMETDTPIYVNNTQIENVESYVYLRQRHSTRDKNKDKENQRRITAGWTAFAKHRDIFKGNIGTCLKRQIYNIAYFQQWHMAETWAPTTHTKNNTNDVPLHIWSCCRRNLSNSEQCSELNKVTANWQTVNLLHACWSHKNVILNDELKPSSWHPRFSNRRENIDRSCTWLVAF